MSKKLPVVWDADAHTIAKIAILKSYLKAWFRILGTTKRGQTILYVDGFAGPGHYRNHAEGSPLAALRVAQAAMAEMGQGFIASKVHAAFIESDPQRFGVLAEAIAPFEGRPSLGISKICCEFVDGIKAIRNEVPGPFRGEGPLFVFADPFGATQIPFETLSGCMQGEMCELLINLDTDGIGRILNAVTNNNREGQLTALFGSDCWRESLASHDFKKLTVQILDLYKAQLRSISGVKFVWSFAMRGKNDAVNYHLVFATKHRQGMKKMKEAMKVIDKTGSYSFSDAHVEQHVLFRDDDAEIFAPIMFKAFGGRTISWEEADVFALNETPFLNPKSMLAVLERLGLAEADFYDTEQRRAGTFPEEKVRALRFGQFGPIDNQPDLFS